jgi:alpha-tubulin suppressor-like RCC1 family protein
VRRFRLAALCALSGLVLALLPAPSASATSYGAFAWGANSYSGMLGDGTEGGVPCLDSGYLCVYSPVASINLGEAAGNSVAAMAGGVYRSMALLTDGTVMTWGSPMGEAGNAVLEPRPVAGLGGVTAIAAGSSHDLALLGDGTVVAWGSNEHGQLGTGDNKPRPTPTAVAGLSGVVAIAADGYHSLALKSDGTVWAWGYNKHGQLGNKSRTDSDLPVEVLLSRRTPLSGITAIAAGGEGIDGMEHSLALNGSGEVFAWGDDRYGQLGNGQTPVTVKRALAVKGLAEPVTAIAAGGAQSMALLSSGRVMTWGWNAHDELGDGVPSTTSQYSSVPVEVSGLAGVTAISAGESVDIALLSNATVDTWGWDNWDELGDEALDIPGTPTTAIESDLPVPVSRLHGVVGIAGAPYHAFAIAPSNALE